MKTDRIEALTFLRFIAALIVVIYHYGKTTSLAQAAGPAITSGPQMVTFFFVLSGFVLMLAYYPINKPAKDFYLARIARIFPVYLVALVVICYLAYAPKAGSRDFVAPFLHLFFVQSWFPGYPMTLNAPGWSISAEVFFYLTFPALLWVIKATKVQFQTLLVISAVIWCLMQVFVVYLFNSPVYAGPRSLSHDLIMYFPLFHYSSFLLGVAGGYAFLQRRELHQGSGKLNTVWLLGSFLIVFLLLQYPNLYLDWLGVSVPVSVSFYAPVFLVLVLVISSTQNVITRFLSMPFFVLLGNISYAVYILQAPVRWAYLRYIKRHVGLDVNNEFYLYLICLLIVSVLSFYLIEKPGKQLILKAAAWAGNLYRQRVSGKLNAQPDQG